MGIWLDNTAETAGSIAGARAPNNLLRLAKLFVLSAPPPLALAGRDVGAGR